MSSKFNRPIPGQSLTSTPGNAPYEKPPEITEVGEAIEMHLDRLKDQETMEEVLFFLEMGVDLQTLVEGILRSAVMIGKHSIDISILAGPVLHEFIRGTAIASGIDFDEGIEDKEGKKIQTYARNKMRSSKMLSDLGYEKPTEEVLVSGEPEIEEEAIMPEEELAMPEEEPAGLMSRRAV